MTPRPEIFHHSIVSVVPATIYHPPILLSAPNQNHHATQAILRRDLSTKKPNQIQLFRERLSEKVHATIPKGIVGGFKFTVL